jgi:CHAD domain-containing protein
MSTLTFDGDGSDLSPTIATLDAAAIRLEPAERLTRARLDTFDGRLHAADLRLERRTGASDVLVLTGRDGVPAHLPLRSGLPDAVGEAGETDGVAVDASPDDGVLDVGDLPAGPFRSRLAAVVRERVLVPHVTLTTCRQVGRRLGREGAPTVAVAVDHWQTLAVGRCATRRAPAAGDDTPADGAANRAWTAGGWPITAWTLEGWTLEVTTLPGHPRPAADLARRLTSQGLPSHEGDALDLAVMRAGIDRDGWRGQARTLLDRRAPALQGYRAVLRDLLASLEANWQGTVHHLDSEFLHQARIAVRRTRSVLAEGRGVLPAEVRREQRMAFAWLGGLTGPARDLDVYVEGWSQLTSPLSLEEARALDPVRDHLIEQRATEHAAVSVALRSERAATLLATWRAWLAQSDDAVTGGRRAERPLGEVAATRLAQAQQQVLTDGRVIGPDSPPEALHELRKDAKRLRYLLESFGPLGGRERLRDILGHLKLLQDNLGEFQDTQVQADRLRASAAEVVAEGRLPAEADAAVERLAGILEARGAAARDDFARCFADYDARRTRRAVATLIDRMSR